MKSTILDVKISAEDDLTNLMQIAFVIYFVDKSSVFKSYL